MIPRIDISFPLKRQWTYWFGHEYEPYDGEYLLNHARTGIVMALRTALPHGGRVGVVAYNCHTVANAVANAGCTPVFMDVTFDLHVDVVSVPRDLDAIVVTNLFGIRNDIDAIRRRCPKAVIVVDNAHGYGLPAEGDFTVYSINQGKFPALGPGGILIVKSEELRVKSCIDDLYAQLPGYGVVAHVRLFVQMLIKAIAYSPCFYWLVRRIKSRRVSGLGVSGLREKVVMKKMAPGIRRIYRAALPEIPTQIEQQRETAVALVKSKEIKVKGDMLVGENAFMAIIRTDDVLSLKANFAKRGIETETHFAHAIDWAKEFGYVAGSCPNAERLTKELLMVPTYCGLGD